MSPHVVANWGVGLTFLRVSPGREVAVARRLASNGDAYWCFGHYDLLHIQPIRETHPLPESPQDVNVSQAVQLYSTAWQDPEPTPDFDDWPSSSAGTVSLLKLDHHLVQERGLQFELDCRECISGNFSRHVLTSLGHSELIVFQFGDNIADLLDRITKLTSYTERDLPNKSAERTGTRPLFAKSFTTALVSVKKILEPGAFEDLQGNIRPTLHLSCQPGAERSVLATAYETLTAEAVHTYGRYDLTLDIKRPVSASTYLKGLLDLRKAVPTNVLYQTVTELEGTVCEPAKEPTTYAPESPSEAKETAAQLQTIYADHNLDIILRKMVAQFHGLYLACEADQYTSTEFRDMRGFIGYLGFQYTKIVDARRDEDSDAEFNLINSIEQELQIATRALYQRYASIEAHLQGAPVPIFTTALGFNRVIAAASAIISDVYNSSFLPSRNLKWEGFVAFDDSGNQYSRGDVYTLQSAHVLSPLLWRQLTHEIGHGAVEALGLSILDDDRIEHFLEPLSLATPSLAFGHHAYVNLFWEIFAHFFDKGYFHPEEPTQDFLADLWESWLAVPNVWVNKDFYLLRSLLVALFPKQTELRDASTDREKMLALIRTVRVDMVSLLKKRDGRFNEFVQEIEVQDRWQAIEGIAFSVGIEFLLTACFPVFDKELKGRIWRRDDDANAQAKIIARGEIVTDEIANPLRTLQVLQHDLKSTDFRASLALIISLSADFRNRQADKRA